jgi:hypothetical protein
MNFREFEFYPNRLNIENRFLWQTNSFSRNSPPPRNSNTRTYDIARLRIKHSRGNYSHTRKYFVHTRMSHTRRSSIPVPCIPFFFFLANRAQSCCESKHSSIRYSREHNEPRSFFVKCTVVLRTILVSIKSVDAFLTIMTRTERNDGRTVYNIIEFTYHAYVRASPWNFTAVAACGKKKLDARNDDRLDTSI